MSGILRVDGCDALRSHTHIHTYTHAASQPASRALDRSGSLCVSLSDDGCMDGWMEAAEGDATAGGRAADMVAVAAVGACCLLCADEWINECNEWTQE